MKEYKPCPWRNPENIPLRIKKIKPSAMHLAVGVYPTLDEPPRYQVVVWSGHRLLGRMYGEFYTSKSAAYKRARQLRDYYGLKSIGNPIGTILPTIGEAAITGVGLGVGFKAVDMTFKKLTEVKNPKLKVTSLEVWTRPKGWHTIRIFTEPAGIIQAISFAKKKGYKFYRISIVTPFFKKREVKVKEG